jgi:hypothetical protein
MANKTGMNDEVIKCRRQSLRQLLSNVGESFTDLLSSL